jgi:hypothetical protein
MLFKVMSFCHRLGNIKTCEFRLGQGYATLSQVRSC